MFGAIDRAWEKHRVDRLIAGYQEAENAVLRSVTRQVKASLRDPSRIPNLPRKEIGALKRLKPPPVEAMIREVESNVRAKAQRDIGSRVRSDRRISASVAERIEQEIGLARNNAALLSRRALSEALSSALGDPSGDEAQRTLNRIADRGLRTTDGRESLSGFTKRALRSALTNTAVATYATVMQENGLDLVVVSNESAECPICRRFEGRTLSLNGSTPGYTTLDMARVEGFLHPNCRHSISAPGSDREEREKPEREEGEAQEARRQDKLQRRVSVAIGPEAKRDAQRRLVDTA
jgi:Phage minor capsid protein 2